MLLFLFYCYAHFITSLYSTIYLIMQFAVKKYAFRIIQRVFPCHSINLDKICYMRGFMFTAFKISVFYQPREPTLPVYDNLFLTLLSQVISSGKLVFLYTKVLRREVGFNWAKSIPVGSQKVTDSNDVQHRYLFPDIRPKHE